MGKSPAVVIIARHGARLDVDDTSWQTASAAPYDTPLSYGGWTQSRALGARIASLLHARDLTMAKRDDSSVRRGSTTAVGEQMPELEKTTSNGSKPRRKVIIHSSPFLRCIQTSIAISAGMAQYQGNLQKFGSIQQAPVQESPHLFRAPPRSVTLDSKHMEALLAEKLNQSQTPQKRPDPLDDLRLTKPILRIDAYLGEWLCADYYEFIAAPPASNMMVAGAKVELMKAAEPLTGTKESTVSTEPSGKTQEESVTALNGASIAVGDFGISVKELSDALPDVNDTSTSSSSSKPPMNARVPQKPVSAFLDGYLPPTPNYAILPSGPIPPGYVAHARDACVDVDLQWDSMREPHDWGDGGEYGEEWSSMHKRLRKGLSATMSWYKDNGTRRLSLAQSTSESTQNDPDEEIILILITHGAGANALIGAMTNQPVLLDIGMGSLTMALRVSKPALEPPLERTFSGRRRSSAVDLGFAQEYEMKLVASTEHLRAGVDLLKIPQLQTPQALSSIPEHRRQIGSALTSGTATPTSPPNEPVRSRNSALGSIRRSTVTSSTSSQQTWSQSPSSTSGSLSVGPGVPSGLWGSPNLTPNTEKPEPKELGIMWMLPEKTGESKRPATSTRSASAGTAEASAMAEAATTAKPGPPQGLWGAPQRPAAATSKRRWTIQEQTG